MFRVAVVGNCPIDPGKPGFEMVRPVRQIILLVSHQTICRLPRTVVRDNLVATDFIVSRSEHRHKASTSNVLQIMEKGSVARV
jgi:hypothetical protein